MSDVREFLLTLDLAPAEEFFREHGHVTLRIITDSNGMHAEVVTRNNRQPLTAVAEQLGLHCSTCQCNHLNDEAQRRVPDNPMSRSWHR